MKDLLTGLAFVFLFFLGVIAFFIIAIAIIPLFTMLIGAH